MAKGKIMLRTTLVCLSLTLIAGCSETATQAPTVDSAAVTKTSFNASGAPTVEFSVPDMMCPEGCGTKVKEILSQQPGAKDVVVDFPAKKAIVAVDKDKFDAKQAIAALVDHQFKNSTLKDATSGATAAAPAAPEPKSVQ